jgi:hypothetical protein
VRHEGLWRTGLYFHSLGAQEARMINHEGITPNQSVDSAEKYAVSDTWAKSNDYKKPFDYTLEANPDQTCRVRRLDMGDLLKLGIAEELDFMSKALMTQDSPDDQKAKEAVASAITSAENFGRMEKMINSVVCAGVVLPKLELPPNDENARVAGVIYADSIPFSDRIELFSVIFESEGLSTFREKQEDRVGNVADVTVVPLPTDESVDVRPRDSQGLLL